MLEKFAETLTRHQEGILAYYDFGGMSSGRLEGMNNKIGLLQRKSYGFRDRGSDSNTVDGSPRQSVAGGNRVS